LPAGADVPLSRGISPSGYNIDTSAANLQAAFRHYYLAAGGLRRSPHANEEHLGGHFHMSVDNSPRPHAGEWGPRSRG
jgi:hypothetical protein